MHILFIIDIFLGCCNSFELTGNITHPEIQPGSHLHRLFGLYKKSSDDCFNGFPVYALENQGYLYKIIDEERPYQASWTVDMIHYLKVDINFLN